MLEQVGAAQLPGTLVAGADTHPQMQRDHVCAPLLFENNPKTIVECDDRRIDL
jgi:hypothetical protein